MIELVNDYIKNHNIIITSSPNNGMTSVSLCIANILNAEGNSILYYNPTRDIDRSFIKKHYNNVYKDTVLCHLPQNLFLEFCIDPTIHFDYIIIDPADPLVIYGSIIPNLIKLTKSNIICTSQIRLDPSNAWKPYSTIEKRFSNFFDYSIWIRNVSENDLVYKTKYIDVFNKNRIGNQYISRYIAKMSKNGGHIIF